MCFCTHLQCSITIYLKPFIAVLFGSNISACQGNDICICICTLRMYLRYVIWYEI